MMIINSLLGALIGTALKSDKEANKDSFSFVLFVLGCASLVIFEVFLSIYFFKLLNEIYSFSVSFSSFVVCVIFILQSIVLFMISYFLSKKSFSRKNIPEKFYDVKNIVTAFLSGLHNKL